VQDLVGKMEEQDEPNACRGQGALNRVGLVAVGFGVRTARMTERSLNT
jgi:hypothetical protein